MNALFSRHRMLVVHLSQIETALRLVATMGMSKFHGRLTHSENMAFSILRVEGLAAESNQSISRIYVHRMKLYVFVKTMMIVFEWLSQPTQYGNHGDTHDTHTDKQTATL